ncbi:C-5 cytosine specific DNA methylase [Nostoc phage N1]|nr:C-5 cytosine specific DNA methylase [Nostoc phage N1]
MVSHHGSAISNEHYTPRAIIDYTKLLIGDVELDPASDDIGNRVVKAKRYFTKAKDGYKQEWVANTVFCNPPGKTKDNMSVPGQSDWFLKMVDQHRKGNFREGIFIGYSIELLCKVGFRAFEYCLCVPQPGKLTDHASFVTGMGRLMFDKYDPNTDTRIRQRSPMHGNVIVFFPTIGDNANMRVSAFRKLFKSLGAIHVSTDYLIGTKYAV